MSLCRNASRAAATGALRSDAFAHAACAHLTRCVARRFEFQADGFAVGLKHAEPLTEALKILDKENKSDFVVDRLYSTYHYSHPPMAERLRAIGEKAKKLL